MGRSRLFICSIFFLFSSNSLSVVADDDLALVYFSRHLQLLAIAKPESKFGRYAQLLAQSDRQQALSHLDYMVLDVGLYWAKLGVNMPDVHSGQSRLSRVLSLRPSSREFYWQTAHIAKLLSLAARPWPKIVAPELTPGLSYSVIPQLAERLFQLGDLEISPSLTMTHYDDHLRAAVLRFQRRHGLLADGIVNSATWHWLNVPPAERARLLATYYLQRSQYLSSLGSSYILVNIPAFSLELVDQGRRRLRSRVIVGQPEQPTPVMRTEITSAVLHPSWLVPRNYAEQVLLPHFRRDAAFAQILGFYAEDSRGQALSVATHQWQQRQGKFPYRLVQRPGKRNALGSAKFLFPNKRDIALHGTTQRGDFSRSNRALSAGCIRMEQEGELADWLTTTHSAAKRPLLPELATGQTQSVWLNSSLPLHTVYWTAWMDGPNLAQFRNDIYHLQPLP